MDRTAYDKITAQEFISQIYHLISQSTYCPVRDRTRQRPYSSWPVPWLLGPSTAIYYHYVGLRQQSPPDDVMFGFPLLSDS